MESMANLRYAYYPGCSLTTSAKEYDWSTRAVFERLGVELVEIEHWSCCGATPANANELLAHALSARNLAWAEARGLDVVVPCSECFKNLYKAAKIVREDRHARQEINAILGNSKLQGKVKVKHPLEVLVRDVGLEKIKAAVSRPLTGLKVAPYYGCLITRPPNEFDRPENPTAMDDLLRALGAVVVDYYPYKTKCCGGALLLSNQKVALSLSRGLVLKAHQRGADCLALGCPMCDMMLDVYQAPALERGEPQLPALFFTQLVGLALGIEAGRLGFDARIVSPRDLLRAVA
jgi:heterodisulfide reductase subunit B